MHLSNFKLWWYWSLNESIHNSFRATQRETINENIKESFFQLINHITCPLNHLSTIKKILMQILSYKILQNVTEKNPTVNSKKINQTSKTLFQQSFHIWRSRSLTSDTPICNEGASGSGPQELHVRAINDSSYVRDSERKTGNHRRFVHQSWFNSRWSKLKLDRLSCPGLPSESSKIRGSCGRRGDQVAWLH